VYCEDPNAIDSSDCTDVYNSNDTNCGTNQFFNKCNGKCTDICSLSGPSAPSIYSETPVQGQRLKSKFNVLNSNYVSNSNSNRKLNYNNPSLETPNIKRKQKYSNYTSPKVIQTVSA